MNMSNNTNDNKIEVGDRAPDFELLDTDQKLHKLSDNKDGMTILAFFPAAGSPVCTVEMCNFRDSLNSLKSKNVNVLSWQIKRLQSGKEISICYR
jgi:glutaredoxin-dependent peroxiredoxin